MEEPKPDNNRRKKRALLIFAIVAVVGAVVVFFYLRYKATHISTDDAFVDGRIHTIASKVSGTVRALHVKDNQEVRKGDLLVEIDAVDYDVRVKEASSGVDAEKGTLAEVEARAAAAESQLSEITARIEAEKANLQLQEANLRQSEIDLKRAENLVRKEAIPQERYDRARTAYDVSVAQVKAVREQVNQAEKALDTQKAVIRQVESLRTAQISAIREKEAKLNTAQLNSGYTKIYAPSDGYVTKRSVEVGNQIQTGQPLLAVVPLDDVWITANYKETQLEKVKPGQKVTIEVDSYPGKEFKGKIDSIMSGTGAIFSLFPPENATGNFVKIVQRIPVKIVLEDDAKREQVLRVGMSVVPTIIVE